MTEEKPGLRSLVGAAPNLTGGIDSVTYVRQIRLIAEARRLAKNCHEFEVHCILHELADALQAAMTEKP